MTTGIYKIENMITHQVYIGQSTQIEERWRLHKRPYLQYNNELSTYYHKLYSAMREYGVENFQFSIIEECLPIELNDKERYWIKYYNSNISGYNTTSGGDTRSSINQYNLDGTYIATYESLTAAAKTLNLSASNLTTCLNGMQKSYGGFLWGREGEEPPKKYKDNRISHTTSSNKRIVQQYSKDNNFIQEYESAHEAARQINKPKCANHITECCQKKRKSCEGYIWKYKEE